MDHTYMRIDGEPWKQPLPLDDDTVVIEISHHGQVNMLATSDCRAKNVHDPLSYSNSNVEEEDEDSNGEDSTPRNSEEQRKFGAADTFRLQEDIDLSRLS